MVTGSVYKLDPGLDHTVIISVVIPYGMTEIIKMRYIYKFMNAETILHDYVWEFKKACFRT